ncbi:MAG: DUF1501 domain-containing protein [Fuerstiella sp.]
MLSIMPRQTTGHASRRELLRAGGLSLLGLNAFDLHRLRTASAAQTTNSDQRRKTNSCIFVFLFGGPSHIDLWDMKPAAPVEVRGEFKPVSTQVPDIQLCEHLPHLAAQTSRFALLRSMTHHMPVHGPACSEMYTGREYFGAPTTDQARPEDWPSIASLVARYGRSDQQLPPSVVLPLYSHFIGQDKRIAGQTGGRMGSRFDPLLIECDPTPVDFRFPGFTALPDSGPQRTLQRRRLLQQLTTQASETTSHYGTDADSYAGYADMAWAMLSDQKFRRALDLQQVSPAVRQRYGYTKFGQSLLMARQLVEAGISLVTVNFDHDSKHDKRSPMWDTHHDNFAKLKNTLCPSFDQPFAAFLQDLDDRGLLDTTLVVATGEFGRTPRIGQFSQNAMTLSTGRDHWPHAFTVLLAGGGVRGGQTYGATSRDGGQVADKPVTPADLSATILHYLGIDFRQEYADEFLKIRQRLSEGSPISELG